MLPAHIGATDSPTYVKPAEWVDPGTGQATEVAQASAPTPVDNANINTNSGQVAVAVHEAQASFKKVGLFAKVAFVGLGLFMVSKLFGR